MADDERRIAKDRERAIADAHKVLEEYWSSGLGQARQAWERGDTLFEMAVPAARPSGQRVRLSQVT